MKLKLFVLLLAGLMLTGCAQDKPLSDAEILAQEREEEPQESPDSQDTESREVYVLTFEALTIEGDTLTSECFSQSKLTMLNVWATYCNPCLAEMPDLGEIASAYDAADFQMLGIISDVVEDASEEEIETAKDLIARTNANYTHLLLNQSLYSNLVGAVDAVPTTFFVNQKGELLGYVVGSQTKEVWEDIINELLAQLE